MWRRILAVILVTGLIVCGVAIARENHKHAIPSQFGKEFDTFAQAMEVGMHKMMTDMHQPGMTGNIDVDFLAMMIPHHEGAVEMARLLLMYGKDPLVRQLAEEIIASQQVEIAAMQARRSVLERGVNPNPDNFPAISGVRGD